MKLSNFKKCIVAVLSSIAMLTAMNSVFAASHNPEEPTVLTVNQSYTSNAYYGDEYYVFTIDKMSEVSISLGRVAINHTYNMTLSGDGMDAITTDDSSFNDTLVLDAILEPGTYYIEVDSDFNGLQRTEPDETWYNIIVTAVVV